MNWMPGTGKTLGFITASLYVINKRTDLYKNALVVIIINKALQETVAR